MSAPQTQYPPLYLWGDLLGSSPKARQFRQLLEGLVATHPLLEARHFVPEESERSPSPSVADLHELVLNAGQRDFCVSTQASAKELGLIERVVEGIVPAGSAVLAMAGPDEDPSDSIRADLPEHGEIILVDPAYRGNGFELAEELARRTAARPSPPPLGVVLTAPVLGPSGYAADGRTIFAALDQDSAHNVHLRPMRYGSIQSGEDHEFLRRVAQATRRPVDDASIAIHLMLPTQFQPDPKARLNILRTTWECDRLPETWVAQIDQADEIWVPCGQNLQSFRRSGIDPSKLRVIPEAIDSRSFDPAGHLRACRPQSAPTRFLSMFDWSERKAPDTLLRAFGRAFPKGEASLALKVHSSGGLSESELQQRAHALVTEGAGQAGHASPDLHWIHEHRSPSDMPALYAQADAFVLCSRGEGWGRPVHEAMAMGLPVLTTMFGGTQDLCGAPSVAWNIPGRTIPCPPSAIRENSALEGLSWFEPDEDALVGRLREIHENPAEAKARGSRARRHVFSRFHEQRVGRLMREALQALTSGPGPTGARLSTSHTAPSRPLLVELEGPLFEASSYACIHRHLARALQTEAGVQVQLRPTQETRSEIPCDLAHLLRRDRRRPDFTIRAGWPVLPHPPDAGRWIQRIDWEYGAPPRDLASLLDHGPDEIWVHSRHVERGLIRAGLPEERIWRLAHGIDPTMFHPDRPPLPEIAALPDRCNFLFVGGPIWRKGADLLLQTWLEEFRREDPVRLILRLPGVDASYADQGLADTFRKAAAHKATGEILILERDLDDAQMGQLYASADLLVHPYRGEGFGMPMLEAMACGLPVLATEGGAADDFLEHGVWLRLPSREVQVDIDQDCLGQPWALDPDQLALRETLRKFPAQAAAWRLEARQRSQKIQERFSWQRIAQQMLAHLRQSPPFGDPGYSSVRSRSPAATA